jgi:hypothetical protein
VKSKLNDLSHLYRKSRSTIPHGVATSTKISRSKRLATELWAQPRNGETESPDERIEMLPQELIEVSERTVGMMDRSIESLNKGAAGEPLDLSRFR